MNTRFDPELSRLAFEDRLIEYCADATTPLLDRVRLLGIAAGRIDVFFMTRIGRLKRLIAAGEHKSNSAMPPGEQLELATMEADRIMRRAYDLLHDELLPALARHSVAIEPWDALSETDRAFALESCGHRIDTLISPLIVEPTAAFPHVRNLRPTFVALARRPGQTSCFVVVELPAELPRLVPLATKNRFVMLEQVIAAELPRLYPDLEFTEVHLFRVTRNAVTDFEGEHDVMWNVEKEVVRRPFQEVVRLEVDQGMPQSLREHLQRDFQCEEDTPASSLSERDTYAVEGLVDLTALEELAAVDLPSLKSPLVAQRTTRIDAGLLDADAPKDVLLHFPFDDYSTSIERLLMEAAKRDDIESIQTTIYRTDKKSGVLAALRTAMARGAAASVTVELKASFDERDNIEIARSLEADGVRVVLTPPDLKVHAKIALVTLKGGRQVALIGTGNMNAVTSRVYIDLWLATAREEWTRDMTAVFDVLNGRAQDLESTKLLVAPFNMRRRFLALIERETANAQAGRPSGIRAMLNGLTDSALIDALYRASQAGVPIDLLVRGICELRPGAKGLSDNIRVVSVLGQLLQHARIFHFRNAGDDRYYIGSADWRPRNLDGRVEVVALVDQPEHKARLDHLFTETFDTPDAWVLREDGVYVRRDGKTSAQPVRAA